MSTPLSENLSSLTKSRSKLGEAGPNARTQIFASILRDTNSIQQRLLLLLVLPRTILVVKVSQVDALLDMLPGRYNEIVTRYVWDDVI